MPLTWLTDVVFSKVSPPPHIILICVYKLARCTIYFIFNMPFTMLYLLLLLLIIICPQTALQGAYIHL